MRNIPGYPSDTTTLEPIARVTHAGKDRKIYGLSLTRELPSTLHAQVAGLGGIEPAEGSIEWAALTDVIESFPTAFNRQGGWPPRTRDRVDVFTGYRTASGDLLAKTLTGVVEDGAGDAQDGHGSGLVDVIARLSNRVNLPPLQARMPPVNDGGPFRHIGLYPTFFTDAAARAARFYSTPPMSAGCVLSAPLMGSAWPERGTVTVSTRASSSLFVGPFWTSTPWGGLGAADATISYTPSGDSRLNRPMEVTCMARVISGSAQVTVRWSDLSLSMNRFSGTTSVTMGGVGQVCRLDTITTGPVTMRVSHSSGQLTVTLRDQNGAEATGTVAGAATGNITSVNVSSSDLTAVIGGVQVAFPSTAWTALGYTRTAFLGRAAHNASLTASPPIQDQTAHALLDDQARAELAAVWIDEDGYLQWRNRNDLVTGNPVTTLTTTKHVHSLPWEEDFTGVSSKVEVTGRRASTQGSVISKLMFWEASASGVEPGDEFEWLIHPDADTDWIMPDMEVKGLHNTDGAGFRLFNRGIGSWSALRASRTDGLVESWGAAFTSCAFVDHRTYRIATSVFGFSSQNGLYEFTLKVPSPNGDAAESVGPMRYQPGLGTPVIRGKGLTMWEDVTYRANAGVWDAPVLSHDVSWFVQDTAAVQEVADLLAAATTSPRPFLREISIVPDPRLQRADIITLSDPGITGVEFRCLIVGISETFAPGGEWSQSLTLRILAYTRISATLGEFDQAWVGQLLSALDAARAGETLAQFDAQPLKGVPV